MWNGRNNEISSLRAEIAKLKRESAIRSSFLKTSFRYFLREERGPDVIIPFDDVKSDSNPGAIPEILNKTEPHDPDFVVFRHFTDPAETILDIGANHGYSTASIWAVGSKASVIAFEPNPAHRPCFEKIKELHQGRFDFVGCGAGSEPSNLTFIVPVIEGVGISGLASVNYRSAPHWTAVNDFLAYYAIEYFRHVESPSLRFSETEWKVLRLDDVLKNNTFGVPVSKISAIKIDVEGHEGHALRGSRETLQYQKPFILIEGANRNDDVADLMAELGYCFADIQGDACVLSDKMSMQVNGAYLHASKLNEYRRIGLLHY